MWNKPKLLNWCANLLISMAVVIMLYSALYVVLHLPIFPINEVKIAGTLTHMDQAQLSLITKKYLKGNFYTLNLQRTKEAFESLPWVSRVSVRRVWPDTIVVNIQEHQAVARLGDVALVSKDGGLFQAISHERLPIFYGTEDSVKAMTESYFIYSKMLAKINLKIAQLSLSTRRAWEITTTDHKIIALGREDMQNRLQRFITASQNTSSMRSATWHYADLRYPNGFVLAKTANTNSPS